MPSNIFCSAIGMAIDQIGALRTAIHESQANANVLCELAALDELKVALEKANGGKPVNPPGTPA